MSRRGVEYVAESASSFNNYGENKIVGFTKDREGVSVRVHRAGAKKALSSAHKITLEATL